MAKPLPCLRLDLEFMPSPLADRPGVFIRDPYHYADASLILPPFLAEGLSFFDGRQTDLDLQAHLVRRTGELIPAEVVHQMVDTLSARGFLHTEEFEQMKEAKQRAFREAPERKCVHAGAAYPNDEAALRQRLDEFSRDGAGPAQETTTEPSRLVAIAAPHVSPDGGRHSYATAYRQLGPELAGRTFVILGTSHYGPSERFGLTRKPFVTPLGTLEVDTALVDDLCARGGDAVEAEDYCHSVEHSIEFQCIFLQHRLGSSVKILPILCGPFGESLITGRPPEANEGVRRFFDSLAEMAAAHGDRLFWVLGIDLAHIGRRYGDSFAASAEKGHMAAVRRSDQERLERVCAADAAGFFELVKPDRDELRWCGYSPLYTFLQAVPGARGRVLCYEQW
ncbi:MAG: AmmeMemoRadiSam system protein B, partial [Acidobacteria bacterium]|nr:AmmeMemoRadiSam system protein B [Acidobacteriota bacterium]